MLIELNLKSILKLIIKFKYIIEYGIINHIKLNF